MSTIQTEHRETGHSRSNTLAWVGIVAGILLVNVKALIWSRGIFNAEVFGYAVAGALIPGAVAYLIAGRQMRNLNKFAAWFLAICVILLLLELSQLKK